MESRKFPAGSARRFSSDNRNLQSQVGEAVLFKAYLGFEAKRSKEHKAYRHENDTIRKEIKKLTVPGWWWCRVQPEPLL